MEKKDPIFKIEIRNKEQLKQKCALYLIPTLLLVLTLTQLHNWYHHHRDIWNGSGVGLFPTNQERIIHAHLINEGQINCIEDDILSQVLQPKGHSRTVINTIYLKKNLQDIANRISQITFRHSTQRVNGQLRPKITPLRKNEELLTPLHEVKYTHISLDIWQLKFNRQASTLAIKKVINQKIPVNNG